MKHYTSSLNSLINKKTVMLYCSMGSRHLAQQILREVVPMIFKKLEKY